MILNEITRYSNDIKSDNDIIVAQNDIILNGGVVLFYVARIKIRTVKKNGDRIRRARVLLQKRTTKMCSLFCERKIVAIFTKIRSHYKKEK